MRSPTYSPAQKAAALRITHDRPPNLPTAVWLQWLKSGGIDSTVLALVEALTAVHEYLLELEAQGLIERTGEFRDGEPVWIDLDGPPFYAYHCFEHPPTETGAAADYARECWQQTPTGWKSTRSTP